jgi:hypothetical protein
MRLDNKNIKYIFLDYDGNTKRYKLYDVQTKSMFINKNL